MYKKWYLQALIVILAIVGVSLEQIAVPNQEIVVQFSNKDVSAKDAQQTIVQVKKQLQQIGVANIQVQYSKNGTLKIRYHSDFDVLAIKNKLARRNITPVGFAPVALHTGTTNFPVEHKTNNFELAVFEIQKSTDFTVDLNGYVLEFETKSHRFSTPTVYFSATEICNEQKLRQQNTAYTFYTKSALAIKDVKHAIPEVRAGPFA